MPIIACPFPECQYSTADVTNELASTLLQIHASGSHSTASSSTPNNSGPASIHKASKIRRPVLSAGGSSEEWSYFLIRWNDYKEATDLSGKDLILQLLECCDEDLRKDLTRYSGASLTNRSEAEVLASIKRLSVREENAMVARVALHELRQDHDEPIRSFAARLRGKASVCKYILQCPDCERDISYMDEIIRDVVIQGLADPEIQLDLLSDPNQSMTLEEALTFIEKKEAGKRSATKLLTTNGCDATRSQYRQQKTRHKPPASTPPDTTPCYYCGKVGHGAKSSTQIRQSQCPAYNTKCTHCHKLHHSSSVCRSKKNPQESSGLFSSDLNFSSLCSITLDHHVFDTLRNCWARQPSKPQPIVSITASTDQDAYKRFNATPPTCSRTIPIKAMADTGLQSCLTGLNIIEPLGFHIDNLIPVSMKMHAANSTQIPLLGAVILNLEGVSPNGTSKSTRQLVYVTKESSKFFLSQEACIQLDILPSTFPTFQDTSYVVGATDDTDVSSHTPVLDTCQCPKRQPPPPKPTSLPFPAKPEYRQTLQQWLVNFYQSSTFNTCPHQSLPMMQTKPVRLHIDKDAKPVAYHTPVPVPVHWQNDVKAGLDQDTRLGVIEPVPVGDPVTWCHRMVVCAKKNGQPRRTVDFQALNAHATRETHHTQSPFHQARSVPHNTKKTVFDCWNGYHSVPLHPDDQHYTTFITPWGRYRYKATPQGYISSGDAYSRRFDEIVATFPNKTKCIDDALLWADNIADSFFQAVEWLDLCGRNGITLNPDKFQFAADTVEFAGFEITPTSVRPCRHYLDAIKNFPSPSNITDVRSWFGLINQVSYAFASTPVMQPFRQLLQPDTKFTWTQALENLFQHSKEIIAKEIEHGVQIFDKSKETCLATDWSKSGLGFWLLQKHCTCPSAKPFCCNDGWKTTLVGSRFTHGAEARYAPIEGEALAVIDALEKARHFVLGCRHLTIAVDHKPLLKIFGDKSLDKITNTRLRNLKEKSLQYSFQIVHIPGVKNKVPDALSRYPSSHSTDKNSSSIDSTSIDASILSSLTAALHSTTAVTWDNVKLTTASDPVMLQLLNTIESGFPPSCNDLPTGLADYYQYRDSLFTIDGVIIYKNRIVVPPSLRESVLSHLHAAHQGVSTMIARAKSSVFWPGITTHIHEIRSKCRSCHRNAPSQASLPPHPPVPAAFPFQCIAADFFHHSGRRYLIIVDRYSNWPIIASASDGAKGLIACLRNTFATYGIPEELSSDGGPEFTSASTTNFLKEWGVNHRLSSVAYPHSNCRAELGVKQAKRIITSNIGPNGELDTDQVQRAILQYRNNPAPDTNLSPAECLFGRPVKDFIPILPGKYLPHATWQETLQDREKALRCRHRKAAERWAEHTRRLPPLQVGDSVYIQNQSGNHPRKWDTTGRVIEVKQFDQYVVRTDGSGRPTLRNRKFLRKYIPMRTPAPRRAIFDDFRFIQPPTLPQSPHAQSTSPTQALLTPPASTSIQLPPSKLIDTPPSSPCTNSTAPHHTLPGAQFPKGVEPPTTSTSSHSKMPLALRRLMDYNSKGLTEE